MRKFRRDRLLHWRLALSLAVFAAQPRGECSTARRPPRRWLKPRRRSRPETTIRRCTPCTMKWSARARVLQLPGVEKPFYIEYRLLDLDVRSVTASFGALVSSYHLAQPLHERGRARRRLSSGQLEFHQRRRIPGISGFHRRKWASTATTIRCARICGWPPTRPTRQP